MSEVQSIPIAYRIADAHASGFPIGGSSTLSPMVRERERTEFGRRLFEARTEAKLSQPALAGMVGMAQSTLAEAEYTAQGSSFTAQIAQATGVRAEWLASGALPKRAHTAEPAPEYAGTMNQVRRIVIAGTARLAEGQEGFYEEISSIPGAGDGYIDIATADPNAYGLRVRGSSMTPAIRDGWYVLVEPNAAPAVGEDALPSIDGTSPHLDLGVVAGSQPLVLWQ
jgi:phage repressor protein C with HTH and peptisase S24 domain